MVEKKGTLRLNGVDSYINLGEVGKFRGGLQRCGVRAWVRGEPQDEGEDDDAAAQPMCLLGMLYGDSLVCEITFISIHRTAFMVRDADGRTLRAEATVQIVNKVWRELHWIVEDAADNRMKVYLNGQKVKLRFTHTESPSNFAPMGVSTLKSFFPSDCLVGGCPNAKVASKVEHCFRGWIKEVSFYVESERQPGALVPLFRWPMGAGTRSILPEVITRNAAAAATTCKAVWDPDESPPTSLSFAGREGLHVPVPEDTSETSWRVSFWAKPKAPRVVPADGGDAAAATATVAAPLTSSAVAPVDPGAAAGGGVAAPAGGGGGSASTPPYAIPCFEMAFTSGITGRLLLNTPKQGDVTFRLATRDARATIDIALAVDMFTEEWHEVGIGTLTGHEVEVSVGGTRGHTMLPRSFYGSNTGAPDGETNAGGEQGAPVDAHEARKGDSSAPGSASSPPLAVAAAAASRPRSPPAPIDIEVGADGGDAGGGAAGGQSTATTPRVRHLDPVPPPLKPASLGIALGYHGYVQKLKVADTHSGDVITELLLDEGVGDECKSSVPGAPAGRVATADGGCWRPTAPPPFFLLLKPRGWIDVPWQADLKHFDDLKVEFFVKAAPPRKRAALVTGALDVNAPHSAYFIMELSGGGERVCVTVVSDGIAHVLEGDSVICDASWHKVTWEINYDREPEEEPVEFKRSLSSPRARPSPDPGTTPSKARRRTTQRMLVDGVIVGLANVSDDVATNGDEVDAFTAGVPPAASIPSLRHGAIVLGKSEASGYVMGLTVTQYDKLILHVPLLDRCGLAHTVLPSGDKATSGDIEWANTPVAKCALCCDGKSTYINIGDTYPHFTAKHFQSFAIDLWMKSANATKHQVLWSVNDAHHSELEAMVCLSLNQNRPNSMAFTVRDSVGRSLHGYGVVDVFDSAWHNVNLQVLAASQNEVRLYVDSKRVDLVIVQAEAPHSFEPLPDLLFGIAAQPCLPFAAHHYDGLIETVTVTAPWNGEVVGHWPLGEGQGATANETGRDALVGDIIHPIWMYTVKPSLSLNLLLDRSALTTVLDKGVYGVEFWILCSTPFPSTPVTLFSVKTTSGDPVWEVTLNRAPEGCQLERPAQGLVMVELLGGAITAVADCGNTLSTGAWQKVTFRYIAEGGGVNQTAEAHGENRGTFDDAPSGSGGGDAAVASLPAEAKYPTSPGAHLATGVGCLDDSSLGRNRISVELNNDPQPMAYFAKADVVDRFHAKGDSPGGCVLVVGDAKRGLDACVRRLVVHGESDRTLANFPLSHTLLDTAEGNRTAFVSNYKWSLKCLPPSAPIFNGFSSFGILGSVGNFGGRLAHPWRVGMRVKCCPEWGSRNRVQSLLSRRDNGEVLEISLHARINDGHAPWWVRLALADRERKQFEVCWHAPMLADGAWHSLELTVRSMADNETRFLVDARELTPLFGICEVPAAFATWESPLYLGCRPGAHGQGVSQHYAGSLGDIELSCWDAPTDPLDDAARFVAAKWNLGTGYGNEITDRGGGEGSLGSLVSCTWTFDAGVVGPPKPPPPMELRDIAKEARVCVSRWTDGVASGHVKRTAIGGTPITHFEDGSGWCSGGEAPQWIQFDLQRSVTLHGIDLQTHAGISIDPTPLVPFNVIHEVWVGAGATPTQKVHDWDIAAVDVMWLRCRPPKPLPLVRTVMIVTKQSPCLVGWRAVRLLAPSSYKTKLRMARESLDLHGTERPLCINDSNHLVKLFRKYDVDRSGYISRKEARRFYKEYAFGVHLSDAQINRLLSRTLKSNDVERLISYEEFCILALKMSQW